jgi:hypothetical protein
VNKAHDVGLGKEHTEMLRKTKDGGFERQDSDGNWTSVTAEEARAASTGGVSPEPQVDEGSVATMIDSLVDEIHGANGASTVAEAPTVSTGAERAADGTAIPGYDGPLVELGTVDLTPAADWDFDLEVPGLVSGDTGRSSKVFKTVRERLKENAKRRREPKKVEVSGASARVTGPAKVEGTERRQERKARERLEAGKSAGTGRVDGDGSSGVRQRYVNRPAPELLGGRPKWVQELFEAHFRSEHTLGMRRAFNRMKISRQDYAIGWLTAFDKFREESSLLRLKEKSGE